MAQAYITTITPTNPEQLYTSFQPRSKEGEEKKQEVFALFSLPTEFATLTNSDLRAFCIRAYGNAVNGLLRDAVREGKAEFTIPAISALFAEAKREFLITRKDLEDWIASYALPLISAAIASKAGLPPDSSKVVKKAFAYRELLLSIASRNIMQQDEIDSCIKVLELLVASGKEHAYTGNVAQGIERKQAKLDDYLAGKADSDDEIDF